MTMDMPPIVSPQEWEAEREKLLVEEKELTRARDALAANAGGCRGRPSRRTMRSWARTGR